MPSEDELGPTLPTTEELARALDDWAGISGHTRAASERLAAQRIRELSASNVTLRARVAELRAAVNSFYAHAPDATCAIGLCPLCEMLRLGARVAELEAELAIARGAADAQADPKP